MASHSESVFPASPLVPSPAPAPDVTAQSQPRDLLYEILLELGAIRELLERIAVS